MLEDAAARWLVRYAHEDTRLAAMYGTRRTACAPARSRRLDCLPQLVLT
jgi:hypothetical protein